MTQKKKLLIISTYKTPCGIAAFTETLETYLEDQYDVEIGVLDQFVLKSKVQRLEKAGDALIEQICAKARNADVVNLQWEPGLLGGTYKQILRRFEKILRSNKNMIVTVHTVLSEEKFSAIDFFKILRHSRFEAIRYISNNIRLYGNKTYEILKKNSDENPNFRLIVHTKREHRYFKEAIGIKNVYDAPLGYIRKNWRETLTAKAAELRQSWEQDYGTGKVFIGFFGFLTDYKGIGTTIKAMRFLPENYVLLIYGGVHPALMHAGEGVSPYVKQIMKLVYPDDATKGKKKSLDNKSLIDRVQFLGAPADYEFAAAIKGCDINVFPYVEIGQSASGPVSQTVELGKKTIVSNNKMFSQFDKYFPKRTYKVDVGNHIQLAQEIKRITDMEEPGQTGLPYDSERVAAFYSSIIEKN